MAPAGLKLSIHVLLSLVLLELSRAHINEEEIQTLIRAGLKVTERDKYEDEVKSIKFGQTQDDYPFRNTSLPWDKRVEDLISRLTLDEKILQLARGGAQTNGPTPAVARLGIGPHQWNNECLRGYVAGGNATGFPQALGLAASFSQNLLFEVARATGYEARAKYNENKKQKDYRDHTGISCFSPVINTAKHPLWGRNQETYGEDPYLSGELVKRFVKGLQGDSERYVLANAGCKHFAAYSGPDDGRFYLNSVVPERDFQETFLAPFHECVKAGTYSIMCSYNSINGTPACANKRLLTDILRSEWGFGGYVVSDETALEIMPITHHYTKNQREAAVAALKAGCNLDLASLDITAAYNNLNDAVSNGEVSKDLIDERLKPLFYTRFRLGEFDPADMNPYNALSMDKIVESQEHQDLAIKAAAKSFVLLKNFNNTLPVNLEKVQTLALVGPFVDDSEDLFGDYAPATLRKFIKTPYDGLKDVVAQVKVGKGCVNSVCEDYDSSEVIAAVQSADFVVLCLGTGTSIESEALDRLTLDLPGKQSQLIEDAVSAAKGKPLVVLLFNAGPLDVSAALNNPGVGAIVACFFPSQGTGDALVRVISNKKGASPAGRLPMTWPMSLSQVPSLSDYNLSDGSTYRFFKHDPLFPFGYGLSYTTFQYSNLSIGLPSLKPCQNQTVRVTIKNIGKHSGDEVSQVYLNWLNASVPTPVHQLVGFNRTYIPVSKSVTIMFTIEARMMAVFTDKFVIQPGILKVFVGGQQPNQKRKVDSNVLQGQFKIVGKETPLKTCTP